VTRPRMTCPRCGRAVAATVRLAAEGQRLRVPARHNCQPPEPSGRDDPVLANLDEVEFGDPRPINTIQAKGKRL
jgi:hypothetical protein